MNFFQSWQFYALASAFFAGLTAILGKIGVTNINSNFATFIRTLVILFVSAGMVTWRSEWVPLNKIAIRPFTFLILSGIATGLSWLCYFRALQQGPASQVAPIDKLSVAFVIVLSIIVLGEPLTWKLAIGGSLVVIGALVLAL